MEPTPTLIANCADYQAGKIVSLKLIQKPTGAVTFFAFDAGQALSAHTAPFDALVQVIEGEAEITIADQAMIVKLGEAVMLPAHKPHALKAVQRFKMLLTMIRS